MCEELYDFFPEDDELDNFDGPCTEDEDMIDAFRDEFPEEGDWEDEEEAMFMNGG